MSNTKTHDWELAGLGLAPFKLAGTSDNLIRYPDGSTQAGGTCDACGQGIRYEFIIASSDGRRFIVGSECVRKTGDKTVSADVDREIAKRKRQAREAVRNAERDARAAVVREANEKRAPVAEYDRGYNAAPIAALRAVYDPIAAELADGKGGFRDDIASDLRREGAVSLPRGRGVEIVCDILAKARGKKGSDAYRKRYDEIAAILDFEYMESIEIDARAAYVAEHGERYEVADRCNAEARAVYEREGLKLPHYLREKG